MNMGIFELVVTVLDDPNLNQGEEIQKKGGKIRKSPMLEVRVKNDKLTLWTCADSLALLARVARGIAEETLDGKEEGESSATQVFFCAIPNLFGQ